MRTRRQGVLAILHLLYDLRSPVGWVDAAGDHGLANASRTDGESPCGNPDDGLGRERGSNLRQQRQVDSSVEVGRVILRLRRQRARGVVGGGVLLELRVQPRVKPWAV